MADAGARTAGSAGMRLPDRFASLPAALSVVDPTWETLDPNPDIFELFQIFNRLFFNSKLDGIELSNVLHSAMTPALPQLRASLLIPLQFESHAAYLFLSKGERDRDAHGPNFHYHMQRINVLSGSQVTVFHTFHDEVDLHRVHWWQCQGPCQKRSPYFGLVKRAMNRAPSPRDPWWADHQRNCGGNYVKIREPEDYGKKKKKKKSGKQHDETCPPEQTDEPTAKRSAGASVPPRRASTSVLDLLQRTPAQRARRATAPDKLKEASPLPKTMEDDYDAQAVASEDEVVCIAEDTMAKALPQQGSAASEPEADLVCLGESFACPICSVAVATQLDMNRHLDTDHAL
ncbi:uncharacterized protein MONBRDRAFT_12453 [Monosiga brevicollis MX1]|uniref:C2H2-type domain-containing protein n=1 Tax=Monosiga brevicollis TaxID=81824 RepID=A9VCB5_MONBE|nr:uncharacterized protein MONBRDRAFT_12453 [Monosiga brevicollis MX1]EDQ84831.1 predicted protein [Monosiga brevicollis MX1]|eukprot:XP_001750332.1 hypothetical protein [Monosiga brevicollis MX1]